MVLCFKRISKWRGRWRRSRKKKEERESLQQTENELWLEYFSPYLHIWPFHELCTRLEANVSQGLTSEAAGRKLARNGKNILPLPTKQDLRPWKFLKSCFSVLGIIILLSSMASFAMYYLFATKTSDNGKVDPEFLVAGIILLFTFFLAGLMVQMQGDDDEDMLIAFDELMPMYCTVIRDGEKEVILTQDLVAGDTLPIKYGQRLPADIRFFSTTGLELNNVALTGHSKPMHITPLASEGRQRYSRIEYIKD
ncbi:sodium/potassium-transporting ATPase subunit alpha-A [Drosophila sechellia]|uniref:sodium/potassium-transporting ATPase subunit alpha-A n=1 Tax=Drosophila sechellia TaxID=7238 RepID=UPI0013DDD0E8|nr:sodium/potassium-transporting ATPase subunit alpha-A [Drosophila sechellia]